MSAVTVLFLKLAFLLWILAVGIWDFIGNWKHPVVARTKEESVRSTVVEYTNLAILLVMLHYI